MLCGVEEIARFLAAHPPFDALPAEVLEQTAATVEVAPDEAVVGLGVRSESADSTEAFTQNAKDMQAVLDLEVLGDRILIEEHAARPS